MSRAELRAYAGHVRTGPRSPRGQLSLTVGIVVGIAITLTVTTLGGLALFSHTVCVTGGPVDTALFWTPFSLVNAPYIGSSNYSANFPVYEPFGLTNVTLTKGHVGQGNVSVGGYFETENWTVFPQVNATDVGPGFDRPCTVPFKAVPAPTNYSVSYSGYILQGPGNTSNGNEPTTFSYGVPQASAVFANGFVSANRPPISTCGTSGKQLNASSSSFDISLTFPGQKGSITTVAIVSSQQNFTYYFPANGGTWLVDNLQLNSPLRGPGLAFSWQPC